MLFKVMWSLWCVLSFLLYPVVAGITQFIYPGPAGSPPIPGIGLNDVLILQWTTTEEFVTPVVLCHAQGAGGSVDGTDANGNAPGRNAQSFAFALGIGAPFTSPTTCIFLLFLGQGLSIGGFNSGTQSFSDSLVNSTEIQLLMSDTPTLTHTATTTVTPTSFSTLTSTSGEVLTTSASRLATPNSVIASPSSSSTTQPAVSTSATTTNQSLPLGLGLGLGIPFLLTILSISFYLILQLRRRRRQSSKTSDPGPSADQGIIKPELDAEETKTIVQLEPGELEDMRGGLHEVEGNASYARELYSEQDLRNVAVELPGT